MLPLLLGLAVAFWMVRNAVAEEKFVESERGNYIWTDTNRNGIVDFSNANDFSPVAEGGNFRRISFAESWRSIDWTWYSSLCILLACFMMVLRDAAYMWRIRILTDKELSWRQSFRVIMVWEFASAMTPGVVGGAAVAMFILNREKINMGRSTALVLITALLDELFYILIVPVLILIAGSASLFPVEFTGNFLGMEFGVLEVFWIAFGIIAAITVLLFAGIFIVPQGLRSLLLFFCRLPFLRRLKEKAERTGNDIVIASTELRGKSRSFWLQAFLATVISWTGRFLVINFLIMAFAPMADQFIVFARQLSMWVLLMVSPTPGGSGIAEFAFSGFLAEFVPFGLAGMLAVLWRLISYYPYLLIGAMVIPGWLSHTSDTVAPPRKP
ncbi:MAG TPA: lysylphosphatidylglycerol synthase transmembrane domain-containing protein [Flavobacteriales bacterium]|nr:lysylphosphatidylglycerol synthase transmembrane domain-containing protein [Flavobacteriales bacterium]HRE95976.1 lysylphosphatidylglycerol synthase transmembrane domain-containing protein [Flavobacteriales bacterium]HRJ34676.1 lysylphosphatidylglycerol synthase transmembrane domain-containing protein [Flavobacteriales bacterium]HRJ38155.1 lysylphosphatidylglycerol synthase transmembrane domain-containing protein [Flavobacteriales bacterium]